MRRTIILSLALAGAMLLACTGVVLAQPTTSSDPPQAAQDVAPGEVLVKFKEKTSKAKKQEVHGKKGTKTKETIPAIDVEVVAVERGKEKAKAKEYKDDPNVEFAEVNGVYEAVQTTNAANDPRASEQWQFNNTKYTATNQGDIDAYEAWNGGSTTAWDGGTTGSGSIAIAILDTGIKEDHEDLQGKVTKRVNYTSSSTNSDVRGHGTHVAGSVAALTNNGTGVAGTCPGCTLYNVKVLDDTGSGYYSWIANGIAWAADNGAQVINMSLGGSSPSSTQQAAVDYAWSKGVVVVAAAGNSNTSSQFYPAAYPNVIAVGATDNTDAKASFSNYGSSWVDVAAPGASILSTTVNGGYGLKSGTSMASPHVAGEAGLIWSKPGLCAGADNACVRNQIESQADPTSGTGTYWANGRINANGGVGKTAPRVTSKSPDTTATTTKKKKKKKKGVWSGTNVTATFSEEMNPATLTTSTVTLSLTGSTQPPVEAVVSCDDPCRKVTLDPVASLAKKAPYTAKIEGAEDLAGNPLATITWSFGTGKK